LKTSSGDPSQDKNPIGITQPRTGQFMSPQPPDGSKVAIAPGEDPRIRLVAWMTDPSNDYFSGAMVNRLWQHFFGVGLVEPVDDLRATNPPSSLELWQGLKREFVTHHFDMRHMMRLILNSRTYQLSSATHPNNETDGRFYSHYYARRLPAEVLLDVLSQSSGVPERFTGYPVGLHAVQLPDPALKSYFLSLFGRSERVTACACERNGDLTMPQLLHLQNSDDVLEKIRSPGGRLAGLLRSGKPDREIAEELFLATVSRKPTDAELEALKSELKVGSREEVFRDLLWALVNSKEFSFNH
jgi:hypothetical protein